MKKFFISLFAFVLLLTGGIISSNVLSTKAQGLITVHEISNADQFVELLMKSSTYDSELIKINLVNDIDFDGVDLTFISDINGNFKGTFEGNGYSISNITFSSLTQYYGIFPRATDATIQNVKISGKIEFNINETNVKEIYAGVLVGYADNVVFKNCEFDSSLSDDKTIELPIYSDFNFGMLAGAVKGNPLANDSGNRANIRDCVNYYNFDVKLKNQSNIYVGGLVGNLQNAYVLNTLNFGNIKLTNNIEQGGNSENLNKQYFGGIVGSISGSGIQIRNSCFGGSYEVVSLMTNLKLFSGAIFGGALNNTANTSNINFVYYTDGNVRASGDNYISEGDKISKVDVINEAFLKQTEYFDQQSENAPFDFNKTWSLYESRFHLQNFMTFSFSFNSSLSAYIDKAQFQVSEGVYSNTYSSRYGLPVHINVTLKPQYVGFFTLKKATLTDNPLFVWADAEMEVDKNTKEQETSYTISVIANATTKGTYSFEIQSETYDCVATISEEAETEEQGLVRVADSNIANPSVSIPLTFTYNSAVKKIAAEGTSGSVYAFDCWKLYYRGEDGEFSTEEVPFVNSADSTISIAFGVTPFDRDFKLVAHFTDENAIFVNFGEMNTSRIKSIKFGGVDYTGEVIPVSPNYSKNLEIVTAKNYKLDMTAFKEAITTLYGENSIETLVVADPEVNDAGETTYKFSLNMRYIGELAKNTLNLELKTIKDDSNNKNDLLWLWITIPAVAVLLIGFIIFMILRRRGGGKGGKGGKVAKVKEKKVSYKDYY